MRKEVAKKLSKFIKTAQAEQPQPKLTEEAPPAAAESAAPAEGEEALSEDEGGEEKKEVSLETISDSIDEMNESLETVVDALEEQKEVLEEVVSGEVEEEFDEFKDEEDIDKEQEMSPEEFGLDLDELITSKEEGMAVKGLRSARKARLATTMNDEFGEPASTKKKFDPIAPAPEITKVKKSEIPDMLKVADLVLELSDDKSKWTVMNKDKPLYTIACVNAKWATKGLAALVLKDMQKLGVEAALAKYKAQAIEVPAEKPVEKPVEKTLEKVDKAAAGDYKRKFARAFRLALTAMNKNLVQPNPLKATLYDALHEGLKIDSETTRKVIEASFAIGATEHFETALANADKYLEMSDEAFVETEATIGDMQVKNADIVEEDADVEDIQPTTVGEALAARAARGSLLISTASEFDPSDRVAQLQSVLPTPKLAGISKLMGRNQ